MGNGAGRPEAARLMPYSQKGSRGTGKRSCPRFKIVIKYRANNRLLTQTNAKTSTRKKKPVNVDETVKSMGEHKEAFVKKEAEKAAENK